MEQLADFAPMVQIFDGPVPLMVEQLVEVLRFFDALVPVAEQVVDVPKIIHEDIPTRVFRTAAGGTVGGSAEKACFRRADR